MSAIETDDQGRIYLPKETREKYGGKYRIVETRDEIILVPVPEDPLEEFQEEEELRGKSVEELKKEARKSIEEKA